MSIEVRRALISVSDKSGVAAFAGELAKRGVIILSTGGTAKVIADAGVEVTLVEEVTNFPEMLDGRVKTLHPRIHGGLLGVRGDASHEAQMARHAIEPIDLLVVDLYPFEQTIARQGVSRDEAIEQIDIGGPAMIRSAAKNHAGVTVITDPADYERVLTDIDAHAGGTSDSLRRALAAKAFARTCAYDAAIADFLSKQEAGYDADLPERITLCLKRTETLRYGENPHQQAAIYRTNSARVGGLLDAKQLHGKALSYNNIADGSAAWSLASTLASLEPDRAGAVIVKHANPCGVAVAASAAVAIDAAFAGDPIAAFGGILACNRPIDAAAAERLCAEGVFLEVIAAPSFEAAALARLIDRWANLRLLETPPLHSPETLVRLIPGGALVQTPDTLDPGTASWTHTAGPAPTTEQRRAARVIEAAAMALASNAVAIGGPDPDRLSCDRLFGAGAGQMDRVTACRIAVEKAGRLAEGAVCVSDAFFPFPDGPGILADAGVSLIVHPGGSKRDDETFRLCEDRGISCIVTGVRHFRHEPLS